MNDFDGCAVFLEHAMLEFLGRIVVESFMERWWVHLIQKLAESYDIIDFFLVLSPGRCDKGEE